MKPNPWTPVFLNVLVLVAGVTYTLWLAHERESAQVPPAASTGPPAPVVDWTRGPCRDGAIRIHDAFATCPRPDQFVRVRSSTILVCVCKGSEAADPEEK